MTVLELNQLDCWAAARKLEQAIALANGERNKTVERDESEGIAQANPAGGHGYDGNRQARQQALAMSLKCTLVSGSRTDGQVDLLFTLTTPKTTTTTTTTTS